MADRTITMDLVGRDRSLSKTLDKAGDSAKRNGGKFKSAVEGMKGGAIGAGAALVGLGLASIKSASDSEQSLGATQTVFGKYANTVISKSKDERDSVRLTASEYREAANLIGAGFKNQGVAADQLAGKTQGMIQIGADLAATYGGSTKEAVEALGSAFKGEFDPIERYGIGLSAAKVQAELVRMGADKLTGSQLALAKQQATTNLITQQAGGALGAAARESKTTAAQTEALKEKYGNLSAELGAKLLPIVNKVLSIGLRLLAWSSKHQTATIAVATAVGVLTGGILLLNLAMLANPVGLVVAGLALLAAAFVTLWRRSQTFRTVMTAVFKTVANVVLGQISLIIGVFQKVFQVLGHLPGKAGRAFRTAASAAGQAKQKVDSLRSSINRIQSKKVNIRVNTTYAVYGNKGGHYEGSTFVKNAKGGPVYKGVPTIVGDGGREELFVPDSDGTILPRVPKTGTGRAWAGGSGGGGDTYIFNISGAIGNHNELGETIVRALERRPAGGRKIPASAISRHG